MSESKPRITGTEMEWPAQVRRRGEVFSPLSRKRAENIIKFLDPVILRNNHMGMLSNGARLYDDMDGFLEYATPEDDSFMGTVAREIAGEEIVFDMLKNAKEQGLFDDFVLSKRVIDDALNTWGFHINLCADADKVGITETDLIPLQNHLATMNIYAGAGGMVPVLGENTSSFVVAQKSLDLNATYSGDSHNDSSPLISVRDRPNADNDRYTRVHITSMDAKISPWASWMTLGTTSIILRMMEHDAIGLCMEFDEQAYLIARKVAYDSELKFRFKRRYGSSMSALEIQSVLMLQAKAFHEAVGLPEEESQILREWERVLTDLEQDPELTRDRVEWVARRGVLRKFIGRHAIGYSDPKTLGLDKAWSQLGPESLASKLRETLWSEWMPRPEEIAKAYLSPPTTTRAFGRAALVKRQDTFVSHNLYVSWHDAMLDDESTVWDFNDPYDIMPTQKQEYRRFPPGMVGPMPS